VGRPVYELEHEMPLHEVLEWREFWRLKNEAEQKAYDKAKRDASSSGRRR
jgi:hypothetical protein